MKVSELSGALLALWVARAQGLNTPVIRDGSCFVNWRVQDGMGTGDIYSPHEDWAQGGPIIETGNVQVSPFEKWKNGNCWSVDVWGGKNHTGYIPNDSYGPTALIAAMRAFVASKFGETVLDEK